jgi:hypothetical protein
MGGEWRMLRANSISAQQAIHTGLRPSLWPAGVSLSF